jgi:hypothetical protein
MMTDQEAFELAVTGVIKQGKRSMGPWPSGRFGCAYRGENGLKCHIGMLIPDDQYKPELEGKGPGEIGFDLPCLKGLNEDLLRECQSAHDDDAADDNFVADYVAHIREIADAYGLDASFIDKLPVQA